MKCTCGECKTCRKRTAQNKWLAKKRETDVIVTRAMTRAEKRIHAGIECGDLDPVLALVAMICLPDFIKE